MNYEQKYKESLERAKEQKSINDLTQQEAMNIADTKFKFGDWIVYNRNDYSRKIMQIYDIRDNRYYFNDNIHFSWSVKECDEKSHLWTIEDAKDGDVLAGKIDGDSYILIYKQIKDGWIETYGHYYDSVDRFCVPSQLFCREVKGTFHPATKEQRDKLEKAMLKAGYVWDADKKELIKL